MSKRLYIIDGHSQIYRAYYAPFRDLNSPSGEPTRATYVFSQMLLNFIKSKQPEYVAMAVDGPVESLERTEMFPAYKATRKPMPEDMPVQVDRICEIVREMGIPILESPGFEADDVLATLARRFGGEEMEVVLISRDKDLDQLVNEHTFLYDPMKDELFDVDAIAAKKGYTPSQAIDIQTLIGDSTDNIPGVPGVGAKTAVKLIAKYGSAEAVLEHADELTPKLSENVRSFAEQMPITRKLVTLDCDVPLEVTLEDLKFGGVPSAKLRPMFEELGFTRLVNQLNQAAEVSATAEGEPAAIPAKPAKATTADDFEYECIDTSEKLAELAGRLTGVERLAVDTETTSLSPMFASLVGVSLSWQAGHAVYIPTMGPMLGGPVLDVDEVREAIGPVLADESIEKIGQNIKYDILVLRHAGFELRGPLMDTMVAAHVMDSTRRSLKMDSLARDLLNHECIPIDQLIGTGKNQLSMNEVPVDVVAKYAAEDADVTFRLAEVLRSQLQQAGMDELFADLEMPLLPVLADMEYEGITVDPERLKEMEVELSRRSDELRDRIIDLAGRPFNVDSPKQLATVMFDELGMRVIKKTKSGPSTDSFVLSELAIEHELPALVLDYRKLTKLLGTYLKALGECIHPETHRVHTSFNQAGTATGRLSSSDPNLQNIPVRTEEGRRIRSAFVAKPGCVLLSADYSQVELRMLAHFCQDPTMVAAFEAGQDIHRTVAAEVFGVPVGEVTGEQRSRAKTVNFGIVYGQTEWGLAATLRISRTDAREFITAYKARFPKIDEYLRQIVQVAKQRGYVETIFGRRRFISGLNARGPARSAAERLAINSTVQGSAADLIKQAMVNISGRIKSENRPTRMLLQIHDELVCEVPEDAVETEKQFIVNEMAGAIDLRVPLKVDVGIGTNWMDAK